MESVRAARQGVHKMYRETVEWRNPLFAPYLIVVNMLFWACVMYLDDLMKIRVLITVSAGIFGWDVLLSNTNERSIAMHVLSWPIQSLWRTLSVMSSLYSAHTLHDAEPETAFWAALCTVGCLLVNPPWQSYAVNSKISRVTALCGQKVYDATQVIIVSPTKKLFSIVKYVVLLQFLPPLWNWFKSLMCRIGTAISNAFYTVVGWFCSLGSAIRAWWCTWIVEPTVRGFRAFGRWLRYWFFAEWWPDLKQWLDVNIVARLRRAFNYFCYGLIYVVCGHWLPPLGRWIKRCFCAIGCVIRGYFLALGAYLHASIVVPTKLWLAARFEELRCWLRSTLHRLAVAIRDSVLWPICVLLVDAGKEICLTIYRFAVEPVLMYVYQRYKIIETAVLIYLLGPVCETIVNNIPEKSPFCDDSDEELDGLLPDETSEGEYEVIEDANDDSRPPSAAAAHRRELDLEEEDFISGLAFPTIIHSESSDEEFDLHHPTKRQVVRRRKAKDTQEEGGSYDDES